jgi:hypothetical protein
VPGLEFLARRNRKFVYSFGVRRRVKAPVPSSSSISHMIAADDEFFVPPRLAGRRPRRPRSGDLFNYGGAAPKLAGRHR